MDDFCRGVCNGPVGNGTVPGRRSELATTGCADSAPGGAKCPFCNSGRFCVSEKPANFGSADEGRKRVLFLGEAADWMGSKKSSATTAASR
jgi:hypothetical protein